MTRLSQKEKLPIVKIMKLRILMTLKMKSKWIKSLMIKFFYEKSKNDCFSRKYQNKSMSLTNGNYLVVNVVLMLLSNFLGYNKSDVRDAENIKLIEA